MPLKAIVEGGTIIGPDLSEEEWTDLKLRHKSGCVVVGPAGVSRREDPASRGTPSPVRGARAGARQEHRIFSRSKDACKLFFENIKPFFDVFHVPASCKDDLSR